MAVVVVVPVVGVAVVVAVGGLSRPDVEPASEPREAGHHDQDAEQHGYQHSQARGPWIW